MVLNLDSKFEKLIAGKASYKASNLGCNLLISRLQRRYSANQSPEEMGKCLKEMNAFFEKYHSILKSDIEALRKI
jgi:hypothetical protein